MFTLIFAILLISFIVKMTFWALKAAWGLTKILLIIVFFPLILIGMAFGGLLYVAIVVLVIGGILSLLAKVFT